METINVIIIKFKLILIKLINIILMTKYNKLCKIQTEYQELNKQSAEDGNALSLLLGKISL